MIFFVILSGCQDEDEDKKMKLLFFGDLPSTVSKDIEKIIVDGVEGRKAEDYQLNLFPMSHEKLMVELAVNNGDIYFLREDVVKGLIDPIAFQPLDELVNQETSSNVAFKEYQAVHPDTDETHTYAVPVSNDSLLMKKLGIQLQTPLVAFIPAYSEKKEEAIKLLGYLIGKE